MVYIVRKKIRGEIYLYLYKSFNNKGKRWTEYVGYVGKEEEFTKKELEGILEKYNKK